MLLRKSFSTRIKFIYLCRRYSFVADAVNECRQQQKFLEEYKVRTVLEQPIVHYSKKNLPHFLVNELYDQSARLSPSFILQNARETIEQLLVFNARRLKEFRKLPYLAILNPSILENYDVYLQLMSKLLNASLYTPHTLQENKDFAEEVLTKFIEAHADTLPSLSKGFREVENLLTPSQVKHFLDNHLKERIRMRLIAHQHIELTRSLNNPDTFVPGGKYNGVIKLLNVFDVIKNNVELVNDITMLQYDQSVAVEIDSNLKPGNTTGLATTTTTTTTKEGAEASLNGELLFPYIEYHLDYVFMELLKNSFRAHIENKVLDPVRITVSITDSDASGMEIRIRDKGKGIPTKELDHVFDYSFTTYEGNEGEGFKTLNVPPEELGGGKNVAGMGFGLPLAKQYIEVFNEAVEGLHTYEAETGKRRSKGLLSVQTYPGWGTDVYLKTANI